ncbi:MAG: V-type ATP synthase subunit I [Methanoculleaceae archaeon]
MRRVLLLIHQSYLSKCLSSLHESGLMEIVDIRESPGDYLDLLREGERTRDYTLCTGYAIQIDSILGALPPEKDIGILRTFLFPQPERPEPVDEKPLPALIREAEDLIEKCGPVLKLRRESNEISERLGRLEEWIRTIRLFEPFDIDLGYIGDSAYLSMRAVRLKVEDLPGFRDRILSITDEAYIDQVVTGEECLALVIVTADHRDALMDVLRDRRYILVDTGDLAGYPARICERLRREMEMLREDKAQIDLELAELAGRWRRPLKVMREEIEIARERAEVRRSFGETRYTVAIEGWIPAKDTARLEEMIRTAAEDHATCIFSDPGPDPAGVPVAYDHPRWLRPFAFLTTLFSRPRYNEIDPTLFIGPMLIFFFGMMLGDAVYGALITLIALILYRGAGRMSSTIRDASLVLLAAGTATVVWGILQGGYCGDFFPRFLGLTPPFVLINPLRTPIDFLVLALVIGLIQLNLGFLLAVVQNLRERKWGDIIYGQVPWFILQPSGGILLAGFFGWMVPDDYLKIFACAGVICGLTLIFRREGPLGFFSVTGYLGDWLSYARLLALALATGGIAMTVNILAGMVAAVHPAMVVVAGLVWLGGHLFNFSLQSLGAFVHSLRLQYVEFFGRFYSGGGREYKPFVAVRKVTYLRRDA